MDTITKEKQTNANKIIPKRCTPSGNKSTSHSKRYSRTAKRSTSPKRSSSSKRTSSNSMASYRASVTSLFDGNSIADFTIATRQQQDLKDQNSKRMSFINGISLLASTVPPQDILSAWGCKGCGEKNLGGQHAFCGMCGTARAAVTPSCWECQSCGTQDNKPRYKFCGGCGLSRSKSEVSSGKATAPSAA